MKNTVRWADVINN